MAVTVNYYNSYFVDLCSALFDHSSGGSTLQCSLHTAYTFVKTHNFFDDVAASEISGTGYTADGVTLTNQVATQDDTNNQCDMDFDDPEWTTSTLSATDAILWKDTTVAATSPLWANIDFGATFASSATTFRIEIDAAGFQSLEAQ